MHEFPALARTYRGFDRPDKPTQIGVNGFTFSAFGNLATFKKDEKRSAKTI
jgi:hypothetical protein